MATEELDRRTDILYQPDEKPPVTLVFGLGLQLAVLCIAGIVLTPAIVIRAAGGTEAFLSWAVFAAVMISGVTTILQAVRPDRCGLCSLNGHLRGLHRGVHRGARRRRSGDARYPSRHLIALPICVFRAPFAVPADPDADRRGNRNHADTGDGNADHLRPVEGGTGRIPGAGRSAERPRDRPRH